MRVINSVQEGPITLSRSHFYEAHQTFWLSDSCQNDVFFIPVPDLVIEIPVYSIFLFPIVVSQRPVEISKPLEWKTIELWANISYPLYSGRNYSRSLLLLEAVFPGWRGFVSLERYGQKVAFSSFVPWLNFQKFLMTYITYGPIWKHCLIASAECEEVSGPSSRHHIYSSSCECFRHHLWLLSPLIKWGHE